MAEFLGKIRKENKTKNLKKDISSLRTYINDLHIDVANIKRSLKYPRIEEYLLGAIKIILQKIIEEKEEESGMSKTVSYDGPIHKLVEKAIEEIVERKIEEKSKLS